MSTPTGIEWTFPLQLRSMLAASASFRTWVEASDVSAASAQIGFYQDAQPTERLIGDCYGFVDVNESGLAGVRDSTGAGLGAFKLSSQVAAWGLEWRVDEFDEESTIEFLNLASSILDEILLQPEARNVIEFRRWDPKTYPLKRLDGTACRYQIAYTFTARQGAY